MTRDLERELGLEPAYDEERVASTWQRIVQSRTGAPRRARTRGLVPVAALALAGAAAALLLLIGGGDAPAPGPLVSRDPDVLVESGVVIEPRELVLDDGSTVTLDDDARLQVLANDGGRFVTLLDRGGARFGVTPGGPRRWTIETELATVEVVGTRFRVVPAPDRLLVEVEHGVVVVRGDRVPGRVVRLTDGERLEVTASAEPPPKTAALDRAPGTDATAPTADPAATPATAPAATTPTAPAPTAPTPNGPNATEPSSAAQRPTPHGSAKPPADPEARQTPPGSSDDEDDDELDRAMEAATRAASGEPLPVDDALEAADRLRAEGRTAEAADLLEDALRRDPDATAAGLAAFTLGRIVLDQLGQFDRAARAFALVIAAGSPSSLVEDAHARRADALLRAGRRADAEAAIDDYERAFPKGRRIARLRARLAEP